MTEPPDLVSREDLERIKKLTLKECFNELSKDRLERNVAKKIVKFKVSDGRKPTKSENPGKPFDLRLPISVNLTPNQSSTVRLGVTCDLPTIVVRGGTAKLFAPGEELLVELKNTTNDNNSWGEGEVVARAFVVDNTGLDVE